MSMFYCAAHNKMEDSDYVGICGIDGVTRDGKRVETCDTYEGGEYRAKIVFDGDLPYSVPLLRKMRKILLAHGGVYGGIPEYQGKISEIEHRIWTLEDNRNHYE